MTDDQVQAVADRLSAIYRRVVTLHAQREPEPMRVITFAELCAMPLKSRIASVDDAEFGLDYAAWVIGETLAITGGKFGGDPLMHRVFARFEDANGPRGASWLDHRWNGVQAPGVLWAA